MAHGLEYAPPTPGSNPHPLRTIGRVAAFSILLAAVLYLLLLQVEPGAPFRQGGHPSPREAMVEAALTAHDVEMKQAAADGNLELHFAGPPDDRVTVMYYNWNDLLYPRQVIVGRDDRVINNTEQLFAADTIPDSDWLRSHQIANILTVAPAPDGGFETITQRVP